MHYYIHIPFCHRVCPYCKFAVSPIVNEVTKKRYLEYLKKEILDYFQSPWDSFYHQDDKKANTIYFGWWTPSILSIEELWEIIDCFPFPQNSNLEFTLESNPEDITEEKVKSWKSLWINRISLWVQSLDDTVLNTIIRANQETILQALKILDKYFEDINMDFILGLPYSISWDTLWAIQEIHGRFRNIVHTSVYILEKERYPKEWNNHYPTEEDIQKEYSEICDYLEQQWWNHYEISNWARPGNESIHNQSYWNHSDYRGFGLSAGSYIGWKRFSNSNSFRGYFLWKIDGEFLTNEQIRIEKIMFGLRSFSLNETLIVNKKRIEEFIQSKLLERKSWKIFPTKTWIFMLDYIISELI